jgi:hypothetical protein
LYSRKLRVELLEERRLLDGAVGDEAIQLFSTSTALFVENRGQWQDESVRYAFDGPGVDIAFTDQGLSFLLTRREEFEQHDRTADAIGDALTPLGDPGGVDPIRNDTDYFALTAKFSMKFAGANTVAPEGLEAGETRFNYFIGDQANWRSDVPGFATVAYNSLYDGIDLHTFGRRDSLKYEFYVAPGADYQQIQVSYDGIKNLWIDGSGALHVETELGALVDDAPYIYQVVEGQQVKVAGSFNLIDDDTYTFEISGAYDPNVELIIDPNLGWVAYLGGSSHDFGVDIVVDAAGSALVTGSTISTDFSGANNSYHGGAFGDAFVAKINSSGVLLWATYLGGSSSDYGHGIAVDAAGNALVTGYTDSSDFAGANNSYHGGAFDGGDAFVAKINSSGFLQWATYLGGSLGDYGNAITVDAAGSSLVTGYTSSNDFAGIINHDNIFLAKIDSSGALHWVTFFGSGSTISGNGIVVDSAGSVLVTGEISSVFLTGATNTRHGGLDAFVAKINSSGVLLWATYLGGSSSDYGDGIAVDAAGNALVTGYTDSSDFAGANNSYHGGAFDGGDAFVAKINSSGTLQWATYLGGSHNDYGKDIVVEAAGSALVTGYNYSTDFVGTTNTHHGDSDAFVAKIGSSGVLLWARHLGGSDHDRGYGIAVDTAGTALMTGYTYPINFAGANNTPHGGWDAFVARIDMVDRAATHADYEIISREFVYSDRNSGNPLDPFDGDPLGLDLGYHVAEVFSDTVTGFYAIGLLSNSNDPILAFRGTQTDPFNGLIEDVIADSSTEGIGYNQFIASRDSLFDWIDQVSIAGALVTLTGHSLGGALAQWTAAAYTALGGTLGEVVTFNSPGVSQATANDFRLQNTAGVTHYITSGDVVSLAGEAFIEGNYTLTQFDLIGDSRFSLIEQISPATRHILPVLNESIGDRIRPQLAGSVTTRSTEFLNQPYFGYLDPEYMGFLAAAYVLTEVTNGPLKGLPEKFVFRQTTEQFRQQVGAALDDLVATVQTDGIDDTTFVLKVPDIELMLFDGELVIAFDGVMLTYESGPDPRYVLQGRAEVETFFDAVADFQGNNYIEWTQDGFELVGALSFTNRIPIKQGGWGIEEAAIFFDTTTDTVGGSAVIATPFFPRLEAGLEFVSGELNAILVGIEDANVRIGKTAFYLQELAGSLQHFASDDSEPVSVVAAAIITGGPEVDLRLPSYLGGTFEATALRIESQITVNADMLSFYGGVGLLAATDAGGTSQVATFNGNATLNWSDGTFQIMGMADVFDGLTTANVDLRTNRHLDIYTSLSSQINFPEALPWVGGDSAAGTVILDYSNNGFSNDDYVAAWFTVDTHFFGDRAIGARIWFSGKLDRLGGNDIETLEFVNNAVDAGGAAFSLGDVVQVDVATGTPWIMFSSEWETPNSEIRLQLQMPSGQIVDESDIPSLTSFVLIDELTGNRQRVVYVDSPQAGTWSVSATGEGEVGEVSFFALGSVPKGSNELVL